MLFNNLIDLILIKNCCIPNLDQFISTSYIIEHQITLDKIITLLLCQYLEYFNNKCDNFKVVTTNFGINNYQLSSGNYNNNLFEVSNIMYKYFVCVVFLDNNSIITFFENYKICPQKGDIIIFPSAWFFIYNIKPCSNSVNNYIVNNIIGFLL